MKKLTFVFFLFISGVNLFAQTNSDSLLSVFQSWLSKEKIILLEVDYYNETVIAGNPIPSSKRICHSSGEIQTVPGDTLYGTYFNLTHEWLTSNRGWGQKMIYNGKQIKLLDLLSGELQLDDPTTSGFQKFVLNKRLHNVFEASAYILAIPSYWKTFTGINVKDTLFKEDDGTYYFEFMKLREKGVDESTFTILLDKKTLLPLEITSSVKFSDNGPQFSETWFFSEIKELSLKKIENIAKDFSRVSSEGDTIQLSKLKGKTVLLAFFSECPASQRALTEIMKLEKTYPNLKIIGIYQKDSAEKELKKLKAKKHLDFPIIGMDAKMQKAYEVTAGHVNYLIAPNGKTVYFSGFWQGMTENELEKAIKALN